MNSDYVDWKRAVRREPAPVERFECHSSSISWWIVWFSIPHMVSRQRCIDSYSTRLHRELSSSACVAYILCRHGVPVVAHCTHYNRNKRCRNYTGSVWRRFDVPFIKLLILLSRLPHSPRCRVTSVYLNRLIDVIQSRVNTEYFHSNNGTGSPRHACVMYSNLRLPPETGCQFGNHIELFNARLILIAFCAPSGSLITLAPHSNLCANAIQFIESLVNSSSLGSIELCADYSTFFYAQINPRKLCEEIHFNFAIALAHLFARLWLPSADTVAGIDVSTEHFGVNLFYFILRGRAVERVRVSMEFHKSVRQLENDVSQIVCDVCVWWTQIAASPIRPPSGTRIRRKF